MLLLIGRALAESDAMDEANIGRGHVGIELCIQRYAELTGDSFLEDVDRAYAIISDDQVDLLFTNGNLGAFEPRSDEYNPIMGCGVIDSDIPTIWRLGAPYKSTFIRMPGASQIVASTKNDDLWLVLYLLRKANFLYTDSLPYDDVETGVPFDFGESKFYQEWDGWEH